MSHPSSDAASESAQAAASLPGEDSNQANDESPRSVQVRNRGRRWLTLLLIPACLIFLGLATFLLWLNCVASARYDADLMTLVPDDVVLTAELRRLDDPRRGRQGSVDRFVDFWEVLAEDPVFQQFAESSAGRDAFGNPPLWERVEEATNRVRSVESPLDFWLGSLDLKEDFFSGEAVVGLRTRSGARATDAEEFQDSVDSLGRRSDKFALVRVSSRIKVYVGLTNLFGLWSQIDKLGASDGFSSNVDRATGIITVYMPATRTESVFAHFHSALEQSDLPRNVREMLRVHEAQGVLEVLPIPEGRQPLQPSDFNSLAAAFADPEEGERIVTDLEARLRELDSVHFALLGDVLAIATEEQLMRDIYRLSRHEGRSGESLWESERLRAGYDAAVADLGSNVVEESMMRVYVDADRLDPILPYRRILDPKTHFDLIEATERMSHTIRSSAIDPDHLGAGLFLFNLSNDAFAGPMIVSDSYLVHDTESVDEVLIASLEQRRERSRISDFMPSDAYAYASLSRDLNELRREIETRVVGETSELLEYVRMLLGTDHFGNELGFMFAPQPLDDFEPTDGNWPLMMILLELDEQHRDAVAQNPINLARDVLGDFIPDEEQEEGARNFFTTFEYRDRPIVYLYLPDDPNAPVGLANNRAPSMPDVELLGGASIRETFGPAADPAYAIVDGFLVFSLSLDLLRRTIDAIHDNGSRTRNVADLAVASRRFVGRNSVLEVVIDNRGMSRANYRTPYEVRMLTFKGSDGPLLLRVPEDDHDYSARRRRMLDLIDNTIRLETHNRAAYLAAKEEAERFELGEAYVRGGHLAEHLLSQLDNYFAQQDLPYFLMPSIGEVEQRMRQAIHEAPNDPAEQDRLFAEHFRHSLVEIVTRNDVQQMSIGTGRDIWERAQRESRGDVERANELFELYVLEERNRRKARWRAEVRHEQHERDQWAARAGTGLIPWWGLQLTAPTPPPNSRATVSHLRLLLCLGDGRAR